MKNRKKRSIILALLMLIVSIIIIFIIMETITSKTAISPDTVIVVDNNGSEKSLQIDIQKGFSYFSNDTLNITKLCYDAQYCENEFYIAGDSRMNKWQTYIKGNPKRQAILEVALEWVSKKNIETYMAAHSNDTDINELKNYFDSVIDWVSELLDYTGKEVQGQDWGALYENYHTKAYNKTNVNKRVTELLSDPYVHNKRGIFEFILGGETKTQLLDVRVFGVA